MRWVALILLFTMSLVCAQTEVAIPAPPQQFSLPANITVNGTIDLENVNITFVHEISNPYNETVSLYMYYNFDGKALLKIFLDGKEIEPEVVSENEYYQSYRIELSIAPNKSFEITSVISYPTFRIYRGRGLWSNTYRFHFPIHLETKDFRRYVSLYGIARGEIKIPEKAYKVTCRNCKYYEEESIIRADYHGKNPRFSFSFKVKRTPYKAMVVYLVMLVGIFAYVIRKRAKT